ncbi:MAG: hypothetical protein BWY09_00298 [Candidatus Hydrogenedentes bacterium ADurb.Bin179]|nr:MAG: hypothetical protein BWY09_00298 [Candidatus Hydrogenedentes bacterium ADurb.Bin179]
MPGAASTQHTSELGPVFAAAVPVPESDCRTVQAHEAAAAIDEFQQVLAEFGIGELITYGVVQEHRIELGQVFLFKYRRVTADYHFEGARLDAHLLEGEICVKA